MKKVFIYSVALLLGASMWSCKEDSLDGTSIFVDSERPMSDYDNYLYREFVVPYNIEVKYRLDDKETDQTHQLTPATIASSKVMSVLLKHLWLDVYNEVSPDGVDFVRQYAVRIVQLVGSGGYNTNGTVVLGTAEGGKKITLYDLDALDPDNLATIAPSVLLADKGTFQVIHHEFAHILHQMKNYSTAYQQLSLEDYVGESWSDYGEQEAFDLGFISTYARKNSDEDFVEMFSLYVTMSEGAWNSRVARASAYGQDILSRKLTIVRDYFKALWGMDIDVVRATIQRRANEVGELELKDLK